MTRSDYLNDINIRVGNIAMLSNVIEKQIEELNELYGVEILTTNQLTGHIHVFRGIELLVEAFNAKPVDNGERKYFLFKDTEILQIANGNGEYATANTKAMYDLSEVE